MYVKCFQLILHIVKKHGFKKKFNTRIRNKQVILKISYM